MSSSVTDTLLAQFSDYHPRRYNKRHILIYGGDVVSHVYYLEEGKVKQYAISRTGDELVLNIFKPGSFFPMSHAINRSPATYFFEAETDITVRQLPAEAVVEFVRNNPEVQFDLLRRVYMGTEGLLGRLEQLMSGNAGSRLIYELILEANRFSTKHEDGSCVIELSEKDLGARAGLSRETVNREIHKLKAANLITIQRSTIHIPSLQALKKHLDANL